MFRGAHIRASDGDQWFHTTGHEVRHLDTTADGRNCDQIALLVDSWLCLLADSPLNTNTQSQKPLRVFRDFRKWLLAGPLIARVKVLSQIGDEIIASCLATGSDANTGDFLVQMTETPVFKEYHTWFRNGDPRLLQYLLTFLYFGKKLDYEDPEMDATALRGWLEVEEKLSCLNLPAGATQDLRVIINHLIGDFRISDLRPKFGPGAVSEPGVRGNIRKSNTVRYHPKLDRFFFGNPRLVMGAYNGDGSHECWFLPEPHLWDERAQHSIDISTLRFVPKDVSKSRSICMEPNSFMFAQQALMSQIVQWFRTGPMSQFVDLRDQQRNRDLARFGSMTTEIDTIDLSSASDSVSTELIRKIMPVRLLHALLATRTSKVKMPDGSVVSVKKFAPMGSAVCFPTQCLVFTGITILAAMQVAEGMADARERLPTKWLKDPAVSLKKLFSGKAGYHFVKGQFQPFAVYGDDIAVDTRITARLIHLLSMFGFSVNEKKSFTGGQAVRESCGGYYWNGEDVTPLRYTIARYASDRKAGHVASVISLCNRAGDRGYRNLRRLLIHHGQSFGPIRFVDHERDPWGVMSLSPRNTTQRRRYNKFLQRDEVRVLAGRYDERRDPRDSEFWGYNNYRYYRWWVEHGEGGGIPEFSFGALRYDTSGSRLCRRWMPA